MLEDELDGFVVAPVLADPVPVADEVLAELPVVAAEVFAPLSFMCEQAAATRVAPAMASATMVVFIWSIPDEG